MKFVSLKDQRGKMIRRFQYTAIDDATRIRASHRTDQGKFYQLLEYKDDVDLILKLEKWELFYNFNRPHGPFVGKTPYEVMKAILK